MLKRVDIFSKDYNNGFYKVVLETDEEMLDFPATKTYEYSIEKSSDFLNFLKNLIIINSNEDLFFNITYKDTNGNKVCLKYDLNGIKMFYLFHYVK